MYAFLALPCSQPRLDQILLLGYYYYYYYRQAPPPLAILPGFVFLCLLVGWFSLPTYVPS